MKASTWLKIAAALFAVFAIGHTFGTFAGGARPPQVEAAARFMRESHFNMMGSYRSVWDFYFGLNILLSLNLALVVAITWQLGDLSRTAPAQARSMIIAVLIVTIPIALVCWTYFFIAPALMSSLAALCLAAAAMTVGTEPAS